MFAAPGMKPRSGAGSFRLVWILWSLILDNGAYESVVAPRVHLLPHAALQDRRKNHKVGVSAWAPADRGRLALRQVFVGEARSSLCHSKTFALYSLAKMNFIASCRCLISNIYSCNSPTASLNKAGTVHAAGKWQLIKAHMWVPSRNTSVNECLVWKIPVFLALGAGVFPTILHAHSRFILVL